MILETSTLTPFRSLHQNREAKEWNKSLDLLKRSLIPLQIIIGLLEHQARQAIKPSISKQTTSKPITSVATLPKISARSKRTSLTKITLPQIPSIRTIYTTSSSIKSHHRQVRFGANSLNPKKIQLSRSNLHPSKSSIR